MLNGLSFIEMYLIKLLKCSSQPLLSIDPSSSHPFPPQSIFVALLRSFHAAHSQILAECGRLTTLTAAVVAPAEEPGRFVVCVTNVGDSLAYVYSHKHGVREITLGRWAAILT